MSLYSKLMGLGIKFQECPVMLLFAKVIPKIPYIAIDIIANNQHYINHNM